MHVLETTSLGVSIPLHICIIMFYACTDAYITIIEISIIIIIIIIMQASHALGIILGAWFCYTRLIQYL